MTKKPSKKKAKGVKVAIATYRLATDKEIKAATKKKVAKKKEKLVRVTSPIHRNEQFFVAAEMADDAQVVKEMTGSVSKTMVYEINGEYALSLQGVREGVRRLNRNPKSGYKIRLAPEPMPKINRDVEQEGQKGLEVWVYAEDMLSGGGAWGAKFEPYVKLDLEASDAIPNRFALESALSKAGRNAMFALLPEDVVAKMIADFSKEHGAVEKVKAPKVEKKAIVPQSTDEQVFYHSTVRRIEEVAKSKEKLNDALEHVDEMPLNDDQKRKIRTIIGNHLKKLK